jgi:hypothetical protein
VDPNSFFVFSDSLQKRYSNSYEHGTKMSGELVAKVFI